MPSRFRFRLGWLGLLVLVLLIFPVLTALLAPWAYHIGGRWTPGMWWGYGTLRTEEGNQYPLFIYFYPDFRSMTRLHLNGQRPVSGVGGSAWLCSAQGTTQLLDVSGDLYGRFLNTEGNQMGIRLLDWRQSFRINPQYRRYFDLYGRWHNGELAMQDDGGWARAFEPNAHNAKQRASVTFAWGSYADFKKLCQAADIPEKARIPPPRN
jgi:hypothetical protein